MLSELAVAKGRLSAFDESCQHSLDRVQTLSAALQEAQQAKVLPSCGSALFMRLHYQLFPVVLLLNEQT